MNSAPPPKGGSLVYGLLLEHVPFWWALGLQSMSRDDAQKKAKSTRSRIKTDGLWVFTSISRKDVKKWRPQGPEKGLERIKDQQGSTRRKTLQETVYAGMTLQAEIEQLSLAAVFSERASDDDRHVLNRISSLCHANTTHHEHFTS